MPISPVRNVAKMTFIRSALIRLHPYQENLCMIRKMISGLTLLLVCTLCKAQTSTSTAIGSGYVDVGDSKIWYEECGSSTPKPAVVLLHDGLMHSITWDDVWAPLCSKYHVLRYDRRGSAGRSQRRLRSSPKTTSHGHASGAYGPRRDRWKLFWRRSGSRFCSGESENGRGSVFDRAGRPRHAELGLFQRARQPKQCTLGSWRCEGHCGELVEGPLPDRRRRPAGTWPLRDSNSLVCPTQGFQPFSLTTIVLVCTDAAPVLSATRTLADCGRVTRSSTHCRIREANNVLAAEKRWIAYS